MAIDPPQKSKAAAAAHAADSIADGYVMVAKTKGTNDATADKSATKQTTVSSTLPHGDDLINFAHLSINDNNRGHGWGDEPGRSGSEESVEAGNVDHVHDRDGDDGSGLPAAETMPGTWDDKTATPEADTQAASQHAANPLPSWGGESITADAASSSSLQPSANLDHLNAHKTPGQRLADTFASLPPLLFNCHPDSAHASFRMFVTNFIKSGKGVDLATQCDTTYVRSQIVGIAFEVVHKFGAQLWPQFAEEEKLDTVFGHLENYLEALLRYNNGRSAADISYDRKITDICRNPLPYLDSDEQEADQDEVLRGYDPHNALEDAFYTLCAFPLAKLGCEKHFKAVGMKWNLKHAKKLDEHTPHIAIAFVEEYHKHVWREDDAAALSHLLPLLEEYLRILFRVPADSTPAANLDASKTDSSATSGPSTGGTGPTQKEKTTIWLNAMSSAMLHQPIIPPHLRKDAPEVAADAAPASPPAPKIDMPGDQIGLMCTAPECEAREGHYVFRTGRLLREHLETKHEFDEDLAREYTGKVAILSSHEIKMIDPVLSQSQPVRGMWMWNTASLFNNPEQIGVFRTEAKRINITDVYVYIAPTWWLTRGSEIADLTSALHVGGTRVWALDGDADYIDVPTATATLKQSIYDLVAFNENADPDAQFYGYQGGRFHNGIAESRLDADQQLSRDTLLRKWIDTLSWASRSVRTNGMQFGAALPFWLHDYEGESLTVPSTPSADRVSVMNLLMPILDEYVVMSYDTDSAIAASRVVQQAAYASQRLQEGQSMPRVLGAVEVGTGVGSGVSYGDTPGKGSKAVVLRDIESITQSLRLYPAFRGMAIHHWQAWNELAS
ncbi:hypothetical protein B0A48_16789 [Cryoendolithus antarcticus]|uniref:Uncharacterized protein n=1 Tax=Cryoendolithus antarcticus TaxID=1507870 RepID=A0A1V8SDY8_9PEZI|nr:hypothetical protein B0A48_16789 [Cryoendolithus antarcticus]